MYHDTVLNTTKMDGTHDFRLLYNAYTPGRRFLVASSLERKSPLGRLNGHDRVSIIRGPKQPEPFGLRSCHHVSIHGLVEHLVADKTSANQKTAVVYEGKRVSFLEFNAKANAIARIVSGQLKSEGVRSSRSVCIGLHLDPSDTALMILFAVLKLGAAYLPLDPAHPEKRLKHVIANARPLGVITSEDSKIAEMLTDLPEEDRPIVITLQDILKDVESRDCGNLHGDERLISEETDSEQTALILYTPGSAGFPQGVILSHRAIIHRASAFACSVNVKDSDVGCLKSSLSCVDSIAEIFSFLLNGLTVVVAPASTTSNPEKLIPYLEKNKVTRVFLLPSQLRGILATLKRYPSRKRLPSVKTFICIGEVLSRKLAKKCVILLPRVKLACTWGVAETGGYVSLSVWKRRSLKTEKMPGLNIGLPIQNTNIYILDENLAPAPVGEIGTCYVSGPNVANGYLVGAGTPMNMTRNASNRERFSPNPFATDPGHETLFNSGEYMRLVCEPNQDNPRLVFEGRRDAMVNIQGNLVDLSEIENALSDIPFFQRVAVMYRRRHVDEEPTLVACYQTLCDIPDCTTESIEEYMSSVLPSYMIPKLVSADELDSMLSEGNADDGDDDHDNSEQTITDTNSYEPDETVKAAPVDDSSPHACAIRSAVANVLKLPMDEVSLNDNYFQLSNSSVNAIDVIMQIRTSGLRVDIGDFFSAKTLEDLLQVELPQVKNLPDSKSKPFDDSFRIRGYRIVSLYEATATEFEAVCRMTAESYVLSEPTIVALENPVEEKLAVLYDTVRSLCDENMLMSFFVRRQEDGEVVAACISQDLHHFHNELDLVSSPGMRALFSQVDESCQLLIDITGVKESGHWCYTRFMAVDEYEDTSMKADLQKLLEIEKIRMARCHGFKGCCGTYSDPFKVAIATEVGHVEEATSDYIKDYEFEGKKHFSNIQPASVKMRSLALQMY
ncbi:beta-alanyl-bioamine nonribosomal peptide synthetase ebony-like [Ptychodera flava]|uniref:beta-alanyl-bioamine nonribosomal peptide synthetase ebony-like n=1 Tax=Ptychodera flava TaxID=63121 RepID=UPI003969E4E0